MEALKKAHKQEIGEHVQTSNKKYNELLTDKLNMEDSLKAQHKQDITGLNKEWNGKLADVVAKVRIEE